VAVKKTNRLRSSKAHVWMQPELIEKINRKAELRGLSRDGAFEEGMNKWVSEEIRNAR
jgi:hypothetical protein